MYTVEKEEEKLRICEFRDAVEAYLTAIEINPWNIDVRNNLGLFYITYVGSPGIPFEEHREYLEKGMDCFREAHRLDPKHEHAKGNLAEGYMSLAVLYHQRRNREVARDYATKCLEIDNQRSVTYCLRAIQNRELGHWEQAVKDCKKAIEIDPKYAEAYVELAATYQKTGRRIEAAEMLKKAAELGHPEAKKSLSENSKPIPDSKKSKEFYCVIVAHTESQANNDVIKNVTTLLKKKGYTPFNYSVPENEDYRKSPLYKQLKLDINKELDDSHKDLHKKLLADIISEALPSKIPTEEEMSADAIKMIKQQEQVSNKRHGRNDVFHPIAILYLFGMQ
jgi:tetratricopeptide (TPR) repeat protein